MVMVDEPGQTPKSRRAGRILVIEDEPAVRELIVEALDDLGYSVADAGDGAAGLALLRRDAVDLIITDIRLPGLSGFDVARAARDVHADIRVLFMSGFGGDESEKIAEMEIMSKPFSMEDLALRVAAMIGAVET